jgi:hypothetical protein
VADFGVAVAMQGCKSYQPWLPTPDASVRRHASPSSPHFSTSFFADSAADSTPLAFRPPSPSPSSPTKMHFAGSVAMSVRQRRVRNVDEVTTPKPLDGEPGCSMDGSLSVLASPVVSPEVRPRGGGPRPLHLDDRDDPVGDLPKAAYGLTPFLAGGILSNGVGGDGEQQDIEVSPPGPNTVDEDENSDDDADDLPRPVASRGVARGTRAFLAPELLVDVADGGQERPSPASDAWALGVTMYALVFGQMPFYGATVFALRDAVRTEAVAFPEEARADPELKPWLQVIRALLHKDPRRRLTVPELCRTRLLHDSGRTPLTSSQSGHTTPTYRARHDRQRAIANMTTVPMLASPALPRAAPAAEMGDHAEAVVGPLQFSAPVHRGV